MGLFNLESGLILGALVVGIIVYLSIHKAPSRVVTLERLEQLLRQCEEEDDLVKLSEGTYGTLWRLEGKEEQRKAIYKLIGQVRRGE